MWQILSVILIEIFLIVSEHWKNFSMSPGLTGCPPRWGPPWTLSWGTRGQMRRLSHTWPAYSTRVPGYHLSAAPDHTCNWSWRNRPQDPCCLDKTSHHKTHIDWNISWCLLYVLPWTGTIFIFNTEHWYWICKFNCPFAYIWLEDN